MAWVGSNRLISMSMAVTLLLTVVFSCLSFLPEIDSVDTRVQQMDTSGLALLNFLVDDDEVDDEDGNQAPDQTSFWLQSMVSGRLCAADKVSSKGLVHPSANLQVGPRKFLLFRKLII